MDVRYQGTTETGKDEWLTPKYITDALGPFDLDPCSPIVRPWPTAAKHYTVEDNGLVQPWAERVFCNPPYNRKTIGTWLKLCAAHKNATGLVYSSTETKWFFAAIWEQATAVLMIKGRVCFYHVTGEPSTSPGKASVLVAWDQQNADRLREASITTIPGKYIQLK